MSNKIIRTICYFTNDPSQQTLEKIEEIAKTLIQEGYIIQTKRICLSDKSPLKPTLIYNDYLVSLGSINKDELLNRPDFFLNSNNIFFNSDLTSGEITNKDVQILFEMIQKKADRTFNFAYVFNNSHSSPFFPSGIYFQNGFSIGLQSTDLSDNCHSMEEWLDKTKTSWMEIYNLFKNRSEFLGIDSSIAPLFLGKSSLIGFLKRLGVNFSHSTTTDNYLKITKFIKEENPKPVGLCGLMLPCLEDFELADEYASGNFSIERNIYLSLHSGLGIDTYPIGIDEKPERVKEILKLLQGLSNKYKKPLSARFVSDGKTKIDEQTNFQNQYLKDVIIRKL
ncbi:DUF711 family protein [Candidatus Daviesbacteria bacterium]|nr:DUF711 family protein [Candidatus Daviesbacteria bacterium]